MISSSRFLGLLFGYTCVVLTSAAPPTSGKPFGLKSSLVHLSHDLPGQHFHPLDAALGLRGGDDATNVVSKELLSVDNLAAFLAVNGLLLGLGFELASDLMMKLMHNYDDKGTPANRASRWAGNHMISYGVITYLSAIKKISPTKAMGWSLVPITAHLLIRDVVQSSKSGSYKKAATAVASIIAVCAASLITGSSQLLSKDVAAWIPMLLIGACDILSMMFPDTMMQALEHTTQDDFEDDDYKLRFVTQAIGHHSLFHLVQFYALWKGKDAIQAVGYSTMFCLPSVILVCIICPNLRKSGGPILPMLPFLGLYAFISWKTL